MSRVQVVHAIIRDDERFLLGKRSLSKQNSAGCWASIGGRAEAGESLEDALVRECREEIGVVVVPGRRVFEVVEEEAVHFWFEARVVSGVPALANDEHSELRWVNRAEIERLSPIEQGDLEVILGFS